MCNVQYYDTLIGFIGHYLKRHDLNIDSGSIYKYNGSSPYKLKEYSDDQNVNIMITQLKEKIKTNVTRTCCYFDNCV